MANNETKKVRVIKTGYYINVYKLKNGNWCDADNCTTVYTKEELIFL